MPATHEVFNQVPVLAGHNTAHDPALLAALDREGAGWAREQVLALGELAATTSAQEWGRLAEANPPVLQTHDRFGHRIDEVLYDPAYHRLMETAVAAGLHAAPWSEPVPGAHVARAAKFLVWNVDAGHGCPISMTYASIPALRMAPDLARDFEPLLTARSYDPGLRPAATKTGLIAGMSMTEKQGGSDVRANTTQATPNADGTYSLRGHKWFTSAPMSDVFLTLAQTEAGVTCFLVPRVLPDGSLNALYLMRLKNKLGNKSNASSEIEYDGALAWLVGEPGRGVRTIVEMVNLTRLDCVLGTAAGMRAGIVGAVHHARHRSAFGRALADQPLMTNVLADLVVESEAATSMALRLAAATDRAVRGDSQEAQFRRLALAVSKYWICKRGPVHAAEAMECLGGNGYVEDAGMARIYREMPLLSIWEGSGNVAALDVLRAMLREPATLEAVLAEFEQCLGQDRRFDDAHSRLLKELSDPDELEFRARYVVEQLGLLLQASVLLPHAPTPVWEAFAASRLERAGGLAFGTLPRGLDVDALIARADPTTGLSAFG